ncbi:MAG TPA: tetratricopeptide repeat protein [Armatimonadota bacterium]
MASLQKNLELGREKLGHGDYLAALAYADAAMALDEASFEALQLRSRALYLLGRDAEALQTLRQAHVVLQRMMPMAAAHDPIDALDFDDDPPPQHLPTIGTDALETLLALRERHQLDGALLALLATLAEDAGRYEIAREAFHELVALEPARLDAWEGLVHILCHEDLDAAQETLTRALALYPTHALFYEFLGFIHFRRRQFRQALIAYRRAIEHGAEHLDNYQAQVECYLSLDETSDALQMLETLGHRGMHDADSQRFIIEVALQCEHFALATQHAHQLMRLQPSHAETYCYKAWIEVLHGDWADAERTLRLGFHKAVDGASALFELVEVLIADGELHAALRVADLASEMAPDHPESVASRGKVLREMGAYMESLDAFRQAATLAPQDDAYQTWMGVVLDNMEEYQEAIRQFNHVLSRHPSDVWTLSNRGLTYLALDTGEQALADFTRGIEIDPQDAALYFWRACTWVKLRKYDYAFRDLHRAVDLSDEIFAWLEQEPILEPLQHDPRFLELLDSPDGEA